MEARYFSSNNYLFARLGHNPSYLWRSKCVVNPRFIVRGGERWCIGTSNSIPLLQEPWIQNGKCIDNNESIYPMAHSFTVNNIMDATQKRCNLELILQLFPESVATDIITTPLVPQVVEDSLVWKAEKNGAYLVKSAYWLCMEELVDTSNLRCPGNWSGVWKLKVPPKVKNFIWRLSCGCLPTRIRLHDKGVQCPTSCVNCNDEDGDAAHVFFHCSFVVQVWQVAGLGDEVTAAIQNYTTVEDVVFALLHKLSAWRRCYGAFGSTVTSNFAKINKSFVYMLLSGLDT